MSTTVTYKGQTLTTVNNETKTLDTAGTWLEDDLTLVDVTAGGGYSIDDIAEGEPTGAITVSLANIASYAFIRKAITRVSAPNAVNIGQNAFDGCTITSIGGSDIGNGSNQVVVGNTAFGNNSALTTIEFNSPFGNASGYQFRACTNLVSAIFHKPFAVATSSNARCFYGCTKLDYVDYKHIDRIGNDHHANCPITALVIRNTDAVPALAQATSGGVGAKIPNGQGYIYVPQSMISAYESATNWSTFVGKFLAIEGSIYE